MDALSLAGGENFFLREKKRLASRSTTKGIIT
jgi:hypothetical protein